MQTYRYASFESGIPTGLSANDLEPISYHPSLNFRRSKYSALNCISSFAIGSAIAVAWLNNLKPLHLKKPKPKGTNLAPPCYGTGNTFIQCPHFPYLPPSRTFITSIARLVNASNASFGNFRYHANSKELLAGDSRPHAKDSLAPKFDRTISLTEGQNKMMAQQNPAQPRQPDLEDHSKILKA